MKIAAAEGLYQTENPASFSILTIGDLEARKEVFAIRIPNVLSLLAFVGAVTGALGALWAFWTTRRAQRAEAALMESAG